MNASPHSACREFFMNNNLKNIYDNSWPLMVIHVKTKKRLMPMKKNTWKTVVQFIVSVLTAALTALGTTSCMGHGPIAL